MNRWNLRKKQVFLRRFNFGKYINNKFNNCVAKKKILYYFKNFIYFFFIY